MVARCTFQHGPNLLSQLVNVSLFVRSFYIIFPKDPQLGRDLPRCDCSKTDIYACIPLFPKCKK